MCDSSIEVRARFDLVMKMIPRKLAKFGREVDSSLISYVMHMKAKLAF